jgi:hypothetical protein
MKVHLYLQNCDFGREGYLRLSTEEYEHLRDMCRTHPESVIEITGNYVKEEGRRVLPITLTVPVRNIIAIWAEAEEQTQRTWLSQRAYTIGWQE